MKRYLLFGGADYESAGGMEDFINDYEVILYAKDDGYSELEKFGCDWVHIYDTDKRKIVWEK